MKPAHLAEKHRCGGVNRYLQLQEKTISVARGTGKRGPGESDNVRETPDGSKLEKVIL